MVCASVQTLLFTDFVNEAPTFGTRLYLCFSKFITCSHVHMSESFLVMPLHQDKIFGYILFRLGKSYRFITLA